MNIDDLAFIAEVQRTSGENRRFMAFQTNLQIGWYTEELSLISGIAINPRGSVFYARVRKSSENYLQKRNLENGSLISEITGSYQPIIVDSNDRLWAYNPDYATTLFLFNSDLSYATIDLDSNIDSLRPSKDFRYLVGNESSGSHLKTFFSNGSFITNIYFDICECFAFDDESNVILGEADTDWLRRKDVFGTQKWTRAGDADWILAPWNRIETSTAFLVLYNAGNKGTLIKWNLQGTELGSVTFLYDVRGLCFDRTNHNKFYLAHSGVIQKRNFSDLSLDTYSTSFYYIELGDKLDDPSGYFNVQAFPPCVLGSKIQIGSVGCNYYFTDFGPATMAGSSLYDTEIEGTSGTEQRVELAGSEGNYATEGTFISGVIDVGTEGFATSLSLRNWEGSNSYLGTWHGGTKLCIYYRTASVAPSYDSDGNSWDNLDIPRGDDPNFGTDGTGKPWDLISPSEVFPQASWARYIQWMVPFKIEE
ncbi:MAG: hypothetical protein DRO65_01835 [Candidatus Altiarchaeales archaeon]|nr:MAG: hypothetical protein DRO65_01835 [Candidatus Altiarchaeales archaeon]